MIVPFAMMGQQTMTVYDGGLSNDHIPAYIYYFDGYTRSQFVIPASSLPTMANGTISTIKFYTDLEAVPYPSSGTTAAPVDVYLMEVDYTTMTGFEPKSSATVVYSGTLSIVADGDGGSMTIDFNTPYAYGGGNLLIGIENTSSAGWQHVYFLGQTVSGAAWSGNGSNLSNITGSAINFIPKTTFTYTPAGSLDAVIGTGTNASGYTPLYGNFKSSYDQMIYTKAQIQSLGITKGAIISKIGFNAASANPYARNVVIYMGQTDKNTFSSNSDFVSINALTKVYDYNNHGPWNITAGWNEFDLDTPFDYEGEGNLVIAVHCGWIDNTSSTAFYYTSASGQALYAYSNNESQDPIPTAYDGNWESYSGSKSTSAQLPNLEFTYTVTSGPSCARPTLDGTVTTTTSTADLSWTENGTATEWELEYSTASDFAGAVTVSVANTPATQITGLSPETTYYARVKALCGGGDESNWSNVVSFDTKNGAIATFPWTEDFNALIVANSIPEDWDNSEGTTTNSTYKWCFNTNTSGNGATNGTSHDGSKCVRFNSYMNSKNRTNFLKTPILDFGTLSDATLSFWYKNPKGGDFSVYISTDGGTTYTTALVTGLTGQTTWTEQTVDISAYDGIGNVVIVFKGTSNYGSGDAYIYLDDVTVTGTAATDNCPAPTGLAVTNMALDSATVSWEGQAASYNLRYKAGFIYDFESATPWTYTDFSPCTTYDGDGKSTYYFENWSFTNQNYTGACIAFQNTIYDFMTAHSGNAFGVMFNPLDESQADDWFILPELAIKNGDVLTFWAKEINEEYGAEIINVGIYGSTDGTFASLIAQNVEIATADWTEYSYDLSPYAGQTVKLAINCVSTDIFGFMFDDIFVGPASNSWSQPNACVDASLTLHGLGSNTTYTWQVQGIDCDGNGNLTDWSHCAYFTTPEFYTKAITGYGTSNGYWYLIASPLAGQVPVADVTNLISDDVPYDLYAFDKTFAPEWVNYKQVDGSHPFTSLVSGQGYLYANKDDATLIFEGPAYNGDGQVLLTYSTTNLGPTSGLNLVGNPFPVEAYIDRNYYAMNEGGTNFIVTSGVIRPMEGVVVQTSGAQDEYMTFSTTAPVNHGRSLALNLSNGRDIVDRTIVRFDESKPLSKIQLKDNSTALYIPFDGKDYAVVNAENQGEMPISFKAEENGTYTLSFNSEDVSFGYLHLVDNMTGNDVDLLANPSYTFQAKKTDYRSRFKLVFATGSSASSDTFAFCSNGSWVINNPSEGTGAATLQVIDANGRILKTFSLHGCASVNLDVASGVYMLRLINGSNVKTQKVVVR